jgi:hypothetical protein
LVSELSREPLHRSPVAGDDGAVRSQEERDKRTIDIMSIVLKAAFLLFVAVVVLVILDHAG